MKCESAPCQREATVVIRHHRVTRFQMRVCGPCAAIMKQPDLYGNHFEICPEDEIIYDEPTPNEQDKGSENNTKR
jgi:hypothetical protein